MKSAPAAAGIAFIPRLLVVSAYFCMSLLFFFNHLEKQRNKHLGFASVDKEFWILSSEASLSEHLMSLKNFLLAIGQNK
jgi:hypothetical protein